MGALSENPADATTRTSAAHFGARAPRALRGPIGSSRQGPMRPRAPHMEMSAHPVALLVAP
eukprot:9054471-Pyramimonas_sp.AAC.1